jgi:hypothetical protein
LDQIALNLDFSESLAPFEQFVESLILAHFEQNVHIVVIFEEMLESHNVVMVQ